MEIKDNSGFTTKIDSEMSAESMPVDSGFSAIKEFYVSETGHVRLFSAMKYGKRYMLKCLKKDFLYTPVFKQALTKEFEIGMQLDHPYICRTLSMENIPELGQTIVMEFVDGCTLQKLISDKSLDAERAERIYAQLVSAIGYMHSKQILHRDLKPTNIMVTYNGRNVKLIDFSLSDSDDFSILKYPAGTTGYMAPELLLPGAKSTIRSDIFSLGKVVGVMAEATHCKHLAEVAKVCTNRDESKRPSNIEEIEIKARGNRSRFVFIALMLIFFAVVLEAMVLLYLRKRADNGVDNSVDNFSVHSSDTLSHDGSGGENKVLDYRLWDKQK